MPKLRIDAFINTTNPAEAGDMSVALEEMGCEGIGTFEGPHEPFLPLAVAAQRTRSVRLYPAVAIAFARNPMIMANLANDMQLLSEGRFCLGLGSQIRPHIEKRYSMPWSHPVERMSEFVAALRAIWHCWEHNEKLEFRGKFYTHTLMTPIFNPGPNQHGWPPIALAGVGERMTTMAGEMADGFIVHPFNTMTSLQKLTLPALRAGMAKRSKKLGNLEINCQAIVAVGRDDKELRSSMDAARMQIAFYGSTPAYRPVLECSGLGELQSQLNLLSKEGKWQEMQEQIDDELLHSIAVVGNPDEVADKLVTERGALVQRIAPSMHVMDAEAQRELLEALVKARDRA
jgi:probable F420-dependent oxidoreductase